MGLFKLVFRTSLKLLSLTFRLLDCEVLSHRQMLVNLLSLKYQEIKWSEIHRLRVVLIQAFMDRAHDILRQ